MDCHNCVYKLADSQYYPNNPYSSSGLSRLYNIGQSYRHTVGDIASLSNDDGTVNW